MSENSEPYRWGYEHGAADIVESGRNAISSAKQHRLMEMVAHDPAVSKRVAAR